MRKTMKSVMAAACVLAMWSCGGGVIRIDETKGVPPVKGSTTVDLSSFTCGQPIKADQVTVQTKKVTGGCELTVDQQVPVLKAEDYQKIPELKNAPQGSTSLVQSVELTVKKLAFAEQPSGTALDPATRVTSATFSLNGQQLADKSTLTQLPKTIELTGEALAPVKTALEQKQPFSVAVKVVVVLPDTPAPPAKMSIDYDAQPAFLIGTGAIKL